MPTDQMQQLQAWRGHELVDAEGAKIGKVHEIYVDRDTGQPEWLAVATGMFGTKVSFVPLTGATAQGDRLVSRWSKEQVKDAPNAEADGELSQEEEARLYQHYGVSYGEDRSSSGLPEGQAQGRTDTRTDVGHDTSGPNTDSAMTRSEEEMRVGTRSEESGTAR